MSAGSYLELGIVIDGPGDPIASRRVDDVLSRMSVGIEPVTASQAMIASRPTGTSGRAATRPGSTSVTASRMHSRGNSMSHSSSRATTSPTRTSRSSAPAQTGTAYTKHLHVTGSQRTTRAIAAEIRSSSRPTAGDRCPPSTSMPSGRSSPRSARDRMAARWPISTGPAGTQVPQRVDRCGRRLLRDTNANDGGAFATSGRQRRDRPRGPRGGGRLPQRPSADEIKTGYNMTTLTFHVGRSIGATLEPGDEIVVTTLDHEANVSPWRAMAADRGVDGPDGGHPSRGRDPRPRGPRVGARLADEARGGRLRLERDRARSTRWRDRRPGARGRGADVRRRGPLRAARADRRRGARHGLPRLLRVQVLRPAPRRAVRQGGAPRPPAGATRSARPTTGSRQGPRTSKASPARWRPWITCATSASGSGREAPRVRADPAGGGGSS